MGVNSDPLVMGSHFGSYTLGDLDDVGIWKDESLDDDQVTTIFEGGIVALAGGGPGDFDLDGELTAVDIDLLSGAVRAGDNDAFFDLNADGLVNQTDHDDGKAAPFGQS